MSTSPQTSRPRVNYTQELRDKIDQLIVQVAKLPSREELAAELEKRVLSVAYQSDREALVERVGKLEQSAKDNWAKGAVIVSVISVIVAVLVATHVI